jgi:hypothetical protein
VSLERTNTGLFPTFRKPCRLFCRRFEVAITGGIGVYVSWAALFSVVQVSVLFEAFTRTALAMSHQPFPSGPDSQAIDPAVTRGVAHIVLIAGSKPGKLVHLLRRARIDKRQSRNLGRKLPCVLANVQASTGMTYQ